MLRSRRLTNRPQTARGRQNLSVDPWAAKVVRPGIRNGSMNTEALPVGVVQLGLDGRIVYRNDRAESVLGCQLQAGEDFATPVGNPKLVEAVNATLGQGCDQDLELAHNLRDGAVRRMNVSLRALGGGDCGITGAIACLSDVTGAAELREELARLVTYDSLTGCLSRRAVLEQLGNLTPAGAPVTVL